jgi:hypothetical protein
MPLIPAVWETSGLEKNLILAAWEAELVNETLISKIARPKWTGGVAQVVEHLLCKFKATSSNPIKTKKKKGIHHFPLSGTSMTALLCI